MLHRFVLCVIATATLGAAADWNPRLAADYLDSREKEWFAFKPANAAGGPCLSCHTSMSYLLARPALRKALGESEPTQYETGLRTGLRTRIEKVGTTPSVGVESVHAALSFILDDPAMGAETRKAFDRMWALQLRDGEFKGTWTWFNLTLDPWEMPESRFYGAALAALATGSAPKSYRQEPAVVERLADLTSYLHRAAPSESLHNRIVLLWASTRLPELLTANERKSLIDEVLHARQADGSWTAGALGPWKEHAAAPAQTAGGNNYATAFTTFVLRQAGIPSKKLSPSLAWLKSHQDPGGYWPAVSLNKKYEPGSMPERFMQDAATAYAVMALLGE